MNLKKFVALFIVALTLGMLAVGCGSSSSGKSYATSEESAYYADDYDYEVAYKTESTSSNGTPALGGLAEAKVVQNDRKLIYTCWYRIETKTFETDYNAILNAIDVSGGFLSNESTYGTKPEEYGDSGRTSDMTLRIPVESFEAFLSSLEGIGNITSKSRSTEDVTTSYYDNEARIELYETHYNKLMDYLANATDMSDIIALESEMTEVLYQLDQLKGTKRHMDDRIAYCTVNITLSEVVEYTEIVVSKRTFGERAVEGFTDVAIGVAHFLENLAIFLISSSPVFALLGILFAAIFFPVRAATKKKNKKKAVKQPSPAAPVASASAPENTPEQKK